MANISAGVNWVEQHRSALQHLAQRAVEELAADVSIRVPRSEADRQNGFERWLAYYRSRLAERIQENFLTEFPEIAGAFDNTALISEVVDQQVWPEVESFLRCYAIRGNVAAWVSRRFGSATTIGLPEPVGNRWRVSLGLKDAGENLGQVIVDADGTVIEHLSSTREQLLEQLSASRS